MRHFSALEIPALHAWSHAHLADTNMEFLPNLEPAGGYSYLKARCNNGKSLTEE